MIRFLTILLFLFITADLFAYTRIYLFSSIDSSGLNLKLGDIARVEGENKFKLESIIIPKAYLKDLMIDRSELKNIISGKLSSGYYISGTGVRVNVVEKGTKEFPKPEGKIKRGSLIKLHVRKTRVNLEIYGTVERDTWVGETVLVKLPNGKKISGVVISRKKVVVDL